MLLLAGAAPRAASQTSSLCPGLCLWAAPLRVDGCPGVSCLLVSRDGCPPVASMALLGQAKGVLRAAAQALPPAGPWSGVTPGPHTPSLHGRSTTRGGGQRARVASRGRGGGLVARGFTPPVVAAARGSARSGITGEPNYTAPHAAAAQRCWRT